MARIVIIIISILAIVSCNVYNNEKSLVVARVGEKELLQTDIAEIIPGNATSEDSLLIADNYIHQWITKQLIVNKAELNLTQEQKDVSKLVEDYRNALLIHIYQQNFVHEKLDTIVTDDEISSYYNQYPNNFMLSKSLVKALFVKIKKPLPEKEKIVKWLKSEKKDDAEKLEYFCFQRATNYDLFKGEWISSNTLLDKIPLQIDNRTQFLSKNKYIISEDGVYCYFIKINDLQLKNSRAPLCYVKKDVRKIILNKRKLELINHLENDIYNDAKNKNKFKIYLKR